MFIYVVKELSSPIVSSKKLTVRILEFCKQQHRRPRLPTWQAISKTRCVWLWGVNVAICMLRCNSPATRKDSNEGAQEDGRVVATSMQGETTRSMHPVLVWVIRHSFAKLTQTRVDLVVAGHFENFRKLSKTHKSLVSLKINKKGLLGMFFR